MRPGDGTALDRAVLERVLDASGVDPARLSSYAQAAEGTFNSVHILRLTEGPDLVLKVAPDPQAPMMSYEHGLTRTEELFYRTAAGRVPVPDVLHADFGRGVIDRDFLLMTRCPGESWHARHPGIGPGERIRLRAELGRLAAALHRITGPGFGYPHLGLAADWRTAFLAMIDAVLADARAFAAALPVPADRVAELVHGQADLLDEVGTPVLVHFDLWPGNILVDTTDRGPVISGLVDGERCFWGDPLAEMVSVALFGDVEDDPAFLRGYRGAGGTVVLDARTRRRLALYRCYLYLIMLVEAVPRRAGGPEHEHVARLVRRELTASLDALAGIGTEDGR
ncbi:phosphotransferase family protein [Marinactinospora rubrisoli]|uniref:Phosphotransferase family protein n=1 Tax=Marinactinospora rubrisoli TaxID=2715399 RepID=A0ABW2KK26_9ACTN